MRGEHEWEYSSGRIHMRCRAYDTGGGLVVVITGGDKPHIGSVTVASPRSAAEGAAPLLLETVMPDHMDQRLSTPIAARLSDRLKLPVAVVAGVHVDGITGKEIELILSKVDAVVESIGNLY